MKTNRTLKFNAQGYGYAAYVGGVASTARHCACCWKFSWDNEDNPHLVSLRLEGCGEVSDFFAAAKATVIANTDRVMTLDGHGPLWGRYTTEHIEIRDKMCAH